MVSYTSRFKRRSPRSAPLLLLTAVIVFAVATALVASACGGSDESSQPDQSAAFGLDRPFANLMSDRRDDRILVETVVVEKLVVVEKEVMMAVATAIPQQASASVNQSVDDFADEEMMEVEEFAAEMESSDGVQISYQPQNRIIVRNAYMIVQSDDPVSTVDAIGELAVSRGGWIVNSTSSDHGFYHITVRVPADSLDTALEQISSIVSKVESINSDSADFTEEFIDLGARRTTVQETVDALTQLLRNENYDSVEELLEVQREITNWQSELESIDGRLNFIRESAAFSRLTVEINRSPIPMQVDVGEDIHVGIGVGRKYTARFYPPDGYDRFEIIWDFGDGSPPQIVTSGLRTQDEDGFLSVPVRHTYKSDEFSPHVVTATVKAFSDRGLAEGEDQLWANVSELPRIDAFISASERGVEQSESVTLTASFNHPETLRNVEFSWDFRDGSSVVTGTVDAGDTGIEVEHAFERHRPEPYIIVFEIHGDSDAGEVEETHEMYISVYPAPTVESSDFDAGGTATNAVNVLIAVVSFSGTAAIWLGITSPIWLIVGAIIFFLVRFLIRRQRNVQRVVYVPNTIAEEGGETEVPASSTSAPNAEKPE